MTDNIDAARTIARGLEALGFATMASGTIIAAAICVANDLLLAAVLSFAAGLFFLLFTFTRSPAIGGSDRPAGGSDPSQGPARDSK